MPGLFRASTWMAGPSPAMTNEEERRRASVGNNRRDNARLFGGLRLRIAAGRHPRADHRDLVLRVSLDQQGLVGYPEDLFRPIEIKRVNGSQGPPDDARPPLGILDPIAQRLGPTGEAVEGLAEIGPLGLNRRQRLADLGGVLLQCERQMPDPDAIEKSWHRRRRQHHDVMLATHRLQQARYPVNLAVEPLAGQIHHGKFDRPLTYVLT